MTKALFYIGRAAQLLGMWMLLVDLFTAGPLGPNPNLFYLGIGTFIAGWATAKFTKR